MTTYRPDIDGLRTLAIMPVVLFHAGIRGFNGGFVGVDIFFVISGYLITSVLLKEHAAGKFSIREFYYRRVLRLFPALFAMIAVVSSISYCVLLPGELLDFSKSVIATTFFSSNILFYAHTGYFAPAAQTMPLLHTWSLAVEEQFYLFWPLIIGLKVMRAQRGLCITIFLTVFSLILSICWLRYDPAATFYLMPTRVWELGIGAILAIKPQIQLSRWAREVIAASGVLLILVAIKFLNSTIPFPGEWALLPCVGAGCVIFAGETGTSLVQRILSNRFVVFVGKISYSVYLWHWPVILFSQTAFFLEQTMTVKIAEIALSLLLGTASWYWVERPFRDRNRLIATVNTVLFRAGVVMAGFSFAGVAVVLAHGLPGRFTPAQLQLAAYEHYQGDAKYDAGRCFIVDLSSRYDRSCLNKRDQNLSMLLLGDSHAAHLLPGFRAEMPGFDILQANVAGCQPVAEPLLSPEEACRDMLRYVLDEWLPKNKVDVVVFAGRWTAAQLPSLHRTVDKVSRFVSKVVLVGPTLEYTTSLPHLLVFAPNETMRGVVSQRFKLDDDMEREFRGSSVQYVSLIRLLCPSRQCRTLASPSVPLEFDYGHFTEEGSRVAVGLMAAEVSRFIR